MASFLVLPSARGDFVWFKNGDVLTGKVVRLAEDKLSFQTQAMGLIFIDVDAISSIDSDVDLRVQLRDGRETTGRLVSEDFLTTLVRKDGSRLQGLTGGDIVAIRPQGLRLRDVSGDLYLGVNDKGGNTNLFSFFVRAEAALPELFLGGNQDLLRFRGDYSLSEVDDRLNSRSGDFHLRYENQFWRKTSFFTLEHVSFDDFRDLNLQIEEQTGIAQRLFQYPKGSFSLDFGLSRVDSFFDQADSEGEFGLAFGGHLSWLIFRTVRFSQDVSYLPAFEDFSDYLLNLESGFSTQLAASWKLKLIYQVRFDSEPPEAVSSTDRSLILTLGYSF
ncbi:MAG: DUF481 domain-containing protein [Planctomycetes bacterium]|nr:DUF481 domain-containing protein [Planctomycetota bacterium]